MVAPSFALLPGVPMAIGTVGQDTIWPDGEGAREEVEAPSLGHLDLYTQQAPVTIVPLVTELSCDPASDKDSAGSGQACADEWTTLQFSSNKSISR